MTDILNMLTFLFAVCFLLFEPSVAQDGPIVDTTYGQLQGEIVESSKGHLYDRFLGIPFALPPVGELRFTKPQLPEAWDGVRSATEYGDRCVQFVLNETLTSEDCLYLNVYVPGGVDDARDLPVMVWVHGGAYFFGSGQGYTPEDLMMFGPVIVITVNYRLGPIGFLSTEDAASPGNYGLWDLRSSLVWIQENIGSFGGDSGSVTLFGQSAGGAMVSHAMISPECQGLFHRGISLSGTSSGFFGITYPGEGSASTNTLAFSVGCRRLNSTQEQVDCLRTVDADELDWWGFLSIITIRLRLPNFIPVIDGDFIPRFPRESWEDGDADDLDLMTGFTEHDAAAFILGNMAGTNVSRNLAETHARLRVVVGYIMGMYPESGAATDALYNRYEDMSDNDTETRTIGTSQGMTDWWFGSGASLEAHLHASTSSRGTYHYNFNYRHSFFQYPEEWVAGAHSTDLYAAFGEPHNHEWRQENLGDYSDVDQAVADAMMSYFTNFATTGDPNIGSSGVDVEWPQFDDSEMLRFRDEPEVEEEDVDRKEDYDFWNNDFPSIARPFEEIMEDEMTEEEFLEIVGEVMVSLRERFQYQPEILSQLEEKMEYALTRREERIGGW